ncbi:putative TfdA family taurine dioxygenase [Kockovaella imperatae]|uniref:Putative TfdA family taurine dioxygenase n=1 Tax=Kockovaella imperatae TaxID=4999 RepID=A0A1Y1U7Q8_9TREE|nr:putative TfdA family taurine dioxygenase [Kockovaella imperatae]ORX34071.1 putative TfdA family taurine dioxygenase [Kockovaella imperatae]
MTATQAQTQTRHDSHVKGSIALRAHPTPLQRNGSLNKYESFDVTPVIGSEYKDIQLSDILNSADKDVLLKDLAVQVSQRGVVFFRGQDITAEQEKELVDALGVLTGKPSTSTLHIHPTTEDTSPKGDQISIITSKRQSEYSRGDRSKLASVGWHADITFEPVPSDYAILKIHTNPDAGGGDTLWASGYEVYSRLSPPFAKYLEGLEALHEASFFKDAAKNYGIDLREGERGSPANKGGDLSAVHPVIRVNPVTGLKSVFVNKGFTRRILGITKDESDLVLNYLFSLVSENHDLQVRFRWSTNNKPGIGDVAIWDNRSNYHTATFDYGRSLRVGDRAVSIGEKPYFAHDGKERRESLGLPSWHQ